MIVPAPDRSRDRRIEDVSNLWVVHPASFALLPLAIRYKVPANAVSVVGLVTGIGAAASYGDPLDPRRATVGFVLCVAWLVADGLDGMVARATGTTSALGRMLDGLCDHGVFILIYVSIAMSFGTLAGWYLAISAGVAHALQSNLYEAERARFHRRLRGDFTTTKPASRFALVRGYDAVAGSVDRLAEPFDDAMERALAAGAPAPTLGQRYAHAAVPAMRLMALLSANVRVAVIYVACLCDDPKSFWWFEIIPLSIVACVAIGWHRRTEARLVESYASARGAGGS